MQHQQIPEFWPVVCSSFVCGLPAWFAHPSISNYWYYFEGQTSLVHV